MFSAGELLQARLVPALQTRLKSSVLFSLFFKPGILLDVKLLYSSSLAFLKAVHQMGRDALSLKVPFRGKRNKVI